MIRSDNTATVYKSRRGGGKKNSTLRLGTAALAAFCAAVFAIFLTACPNAAGDGGSGGGSSAGPAPADPYSFVHIPGVIITGKNPTYTLPGSEDYWKGVFIEGRKVTLSPYMLGKTEVTYKLWKEVYDWAQTNGYTFANAGQKGSNGTEPVTMVSWRDCIVWCNAYTEKEKGIDACVYRKSSADPAVLKNANDTGSCDAAYADMGKKGFRLPTEAEWEYAARRQGTDKTNAEQYGDVWLTKVNSASGATADWNNAEETKAVAWYTGNSESKTHPVGEKRANLLGLKDMSGNVWEWCFDLHGNITADSQTDPQGAGGGTSRVARGGSWYDDASDCAVGRRSNGNPDYRGSSLGFRLACRP